MNSKLAVAVCGGQVQCDHWHRVDLAMLAYVIEMKPRADVPVISCHSVAALLSPSLINQVAVNRNHPHFQGTFQPVMKPTEHQTEQLNFCFAQNLHRQIGLVTMLQRS